MTTFFRAVSNVFWLILVLNGCAADPIAVVEAQPEPEGIDGTTIEDGEEPEDGASIYYKNTVFEDVYPLYEPVGGEEFFCNYFPTEDSELDGSAIVLFLPEPKPDVVDRNGDVVIDYQGGLRAYFDGCKGVLCGLQQADSIYTVFWDDGPDDGKVEALLLGTGSSLVLKVEGQLSHNSDLEFWIPHTELGTREDGDPVDMWYTSHPQNMDTTIPFWNYFVADLYEEVDGSNERPYYGRVECAATSSTAPLICERKEGEEEEGCYYQYSAP